MCAIFMFYDGQSTRLKTNIFSSLKWSPSTLGSDLGSAVTVALISIPEGMAYALVAGVDPIFGLYTGMVTTIVASLTASTTLLIMTLTNALALSSYFSC